jgi:hypothetical protein
VTAPQCSIEVLRASGGYTEHLNPFEVVIDDEVVGQLGASEAGVFSVTPGSHELFVKIHWCRSGKINVRMTEGERVTFRCETRANLLTDGFWATLGRQHYLRLAEVARSLSSESMIPSRRMQVNVAVGTGSKQSGDIERSARPLGIAGARRRGQQAVSLFSVFVVLLFLTKGIDALTGVSLVFIVLQAIIAIDFHVIAPRLAVRHQGKSHGFLQIRIVEEAIISAVFAVVGVAILSGVIHVGDIAGFLAMGAGAFGAVNVITIHRGLQANGNDR